MEPKNSEELKEQINIKRKMPIHRTKELLKKLPDKKPHVEFISALLTIPVLVTVILLNLNNLKSQKPNTQTSATLTPAVTSKPRTPSSSQNSYVSPSSSNSINTPTTQPTISSQECLKAIGPIDISYPQEGQTVSDNPLCVNINRSGDNYCSVVWAYKINGAPQTDYSNNSPCFYNLPQGSNIFMLQIKSLSSSDSKTLTRHFNIQSNAGVSITPTNSSTPSATTNNQ